MTTIYISQQGASIHRRNGRIIIQKGDEVLIDLPETCVEQIVLFGNVNLTTPVIGYCLQNQIPVAFLSLSGKYRGALHSDGTKTAAIRQKQYARSLDADFGLRQAKAFVSGKIANQLALLRRHQENAPISQLMTRIHQLMKKVETLADIQTLLGIEGAAAAAYFEAFAGRLPSEWQFVKRLSRPAPDSVNGLLNFAYSLLYHRVVSELHIAGLDPFLGYLHRQRHGHAALASDLMEEFRPLIADSLVLKLLRKRQILPDDFAPDETGEWQLQPAARQVFLRSFEERLHTQIRYPLFADKRFALQQILALQVRHFVHIITDEEQTYRPFTVK